MAKIDIRPSSFTLSEKTLKTPEEDIDDQFRIFEIIEYGPATTKTGGEADIKISVGEFSLDYVNNQLFQLNNRLTRLQTKLQSEISRWEGFKSEIESKIASSPIRLDK